MALTKYLISASPGKPVNVGGNVFLTWFAGALAISTLKPAKFRVGALELEKHELLNGSCRKVAQFLDHDHDIVYAHFECKRVLMSPSW